MPFISESLIQTDVVLYIFSLIQMQTMSKNDEEPGGLQQKSCLDRHADLSMCCCQRETEGTSFKSASD